MKLRLGAAIAVAALMASSAANAVLFTFDPTGSSGAGAGTATNAALIDQAPGNALADGGISAIQNFAAGGPASGNNFTLYYQANLAAIEDVNGIPLYTNSNGGDYFTFVAGFGETVTSVGSNNTATFTFNPSASVNYFTMYATSAAGDNLNGTGFATGSAILQGVVKGIPSSGFNISNTNGGNLDQSPNGNQWGTQQTVSGTGSSDITLQVTSLNTGYFPTLDLNKFLYLSFFNTSQIDPFKQIDPSKCMSTATSTCDSGGGITTVGTLGATNGVQGPNFLFQADANQSVAIPEPGTVALLGLGLAMLGMRGVRFRRIGRTAC